MLKLTATTTDTTIEAHSRDELRDAMLQFLSENKSEINKMNKAQRVERCKLIRDDLKRQAGDREDHLETQRQAKLETERKNPVYCAAINVLHEGVEKRYEELVGMVKEWQEKVANSDPLSVVWNCESGIKNMIFASEYAGKIQHLVRYLAKQCDERTDTVQQIKKHIADNANELAKQCMNDEDYNHNSTCEMDSVKSREKFRALQHAARLLGQVVDAFDRDTACDNPADAMHGKYIRDSRCW